MPTVKHFMQYIEFVVKYIVRHTTYIIDDIENVIDIILYIIDAAVGISSFLIVIMIVVLAGIIASIYLLIQTIREERCFKVKESSLSKEDITNKWLRILKKIYWYGFACNLLITPAFLFFPVPVSIRGYLFAAIAFSWSFGSMILAIAFSKLKESFSKKYMLLAILALYISYWCLCLWMVASFFMLLELN